jgi:hypothetical protein
MHCAYCGVDYRPGETCPCAPRDRPRRMIEPRRRVIRFWGIQGKRMLFARLALTRARRYSQVPGANTHVNTSPERSARSGIFLPDLSRHFMD